MVLINIDRLSDSELKYIAQQEEIDNWQNLSREELIEAIEEIYDADRTVSDINAAKYVNSISDAGSDVLQFPGVRPLPQSFSESFIHMVQRDSCWALAFWNIGENLRNRIESLNAQLVIKTCALSNKDKIEESYEIEVGMHDTEWTVEMPWRYKNYKLQLIARTVTRDEIICESGTVYCAGCYVADHPELLKKEDSFKLLISPLIAKDGSVLANRDVALITETYRKETLK